MKIGDIIYRVAKENYPERDSAHKVERFNDDGTKVVLRGQYEGQPVGKAVTVKLSNIKEGRPPSGTFNGTFYKP